MIDYIKTAHDAVKYCTNTPNKYELQKFKCFFKAFVLVVYWELSQLRPSKMGAYLTDTDTNAAKYCTNTAKWDILQSTEYFLAGFITIGGAKWVLVREMR